MFCFLIPFGFTDILVWWAPVASLLVAYTLFGSDALSEELKCPFDDLDDALPLNSITNIVKRDMHSTWSATTQLGSANQ